MVGRLLRRKARQRVCSRVLEAGGVMLLSGITLTSCYAHVPVEDGSLSPQQEVRVWLNAEGEAAVAPILGNDVKSLDGTVVRTDPSGLSLEVPVGVRQAGFHSELLRQEIILRPTHVTMLQRRELDRARTAIVVTGAGAALTAAAWAAMTGWTGASSDRPIEDGAPQVRIPLLAIPLR